MDELKNQVGLLKLKKFSNINKSCDLSDQNPYVRMIHLDNEEEVDYFGKRSSIQEQKNLLKMIFKHFSNVDHKKCQYI